MRLGWTDHELSEAEWRHNEASQTIARWSTFVLEHNLILPQRGHTEKNIKGTPDIANKRISRL